MWAIFEQAFKTGRGFQKISNYDVIMYVLLGMHTWTSYEADVKITSDNSFN